MYRTTTFGPINIPANDPHIVSNISQPMRTLSCKAVAFGERSMDEMCEHCIWLRFDRAAFLAARH